MGVKKRTRAVARLATLSAGRSAVPAFWRGGCFALHPVTYTATAFSGAPIGVDAILVEVEVDLSAQLPAMSTVGLARTEVRESKDRVRSAIRNAGFKFPQRRITVNLAPADLPKAGTAFDLPIATAVLAAAGDVRDRKSVV